MLNNIILVDSGDQFDVVVDGVDEEGLCLATVVARVDSLEKFLLGDHLDGVDLLAEVVPADEDPGVGPPAETDVFDMETALDDVYCLC